jgi:hypothetical protein
MSTATLVDAKRVATAKARAALRGIVLHQLADDSGRPEFVATQGAWTRSFSTIEAVEAWLDQREGRQS